MALRVTGILNLDGSGFFSTLNRAESAATRFGRTIATSVGSRIAGLFSIGAMGALARQTMEYAGKLTDLSSRTGVSVENLQRLDRAARENGTTLESLISFWDRLGTAREAALKNPGGAQDVAFRRLGVQQQSLRELSPENLMRQIAVAFQNTTNVNELIAPLRAVGGKGAAEMVTLFREGLDQMYQDIGVMSGTTADELDELSDKFESLKTSIVAGFAPVLLKLIGWFTEAQNAIGAFLTGVKTMLHGIATGVEASPEQLFKEGYFQSVIADQEEEAAKKKAREERIKRRLSFGKLNFDELVKPDTKTPAASIPKIQSDALVSVGNFLGQNQNQLARVQSQMLTVLQAIERNTRQQDSGSTDAFPD